jgi:hypothetical protein
MEQDIRLTITWSTPEPLFPVVIMTCKTVILLCVIQIKTTLTTPALILLFADVVRIP